MTDCLFVTGGAGFIGSALVRHLISATTYRVVVLDAFTYAGNPDNLQEVFGSDRLEVVRADVRDQDRILDLLRAHKPAGVFHLAAESHVDRSIDGPRAFIETNVVGTYALLEALRVYLAEGGTPTSFRLVHVSTDEVFGSLGADGLFTEATRYDPSSPYSATKAASDHLVRAWSRTFGLPAVVTNCSNNYGPCQFPEKLIPHMILSAIEGRELPVYGDGSNVRDWLHVEDHVRALVAAYERGRNGATYLIGGNAERTNLKVVEEICGILDRLRPRADGLSYRLQVRFVADRPGHDPRYAIDASRTRDELGWMPSYTFEAGLEQTVRWYLDNEAWWSRIRSGAYRGERLGRAV